MPRQLPPIGRCRWPKKRWRILRPVRCDDCPEGLRVAQRELVHRRDAERQRRVVHRDIQRLVASRGELPRQPFLAFRTIAAPRGAGFDGIEQQEAPGRGVERRLHEVAVGGQLRKLAPQRRPAVVVAGQQVGRHRQSLSVSASEA